MKRPQFVERQYEAAVHIELARGRASPFVPTQLIEAYIGIDAAADPVKRHAIWRILSVHIPRRIPLSPALWPGLPPQFHDEIPGRFCSLFMQFKRPVFQDNSRAKYHAPMGGHYFEASITPHQQKELLALQARVRTKAVVRYASPAFWSRADFDLYDEQRQILINSAFICPSRIKLHRKWIYAGPSGKVILNPEPEYSESEGWEAIIAEMTELAVNQSFRKHVRSLAESVSESRDKDLALDRSSWQRRILQYGQFSQEDLDLLSDLSLVARAADATDSTWIVILLPNNDWKSLFRDAPIWAWRWPLWW